MMIGDFFIILIPLNWLLREELNSIINILMDIQTSNQAALHRKNKTRQEFLYFYDLLLSGNTTGNSTAKWEGILIF